MHQSQRHDQGPSARCEKLQRKGAFRRGRRHAAQSPAVAEASGWSTRGRPVGELRDDSDGAQAGSTSTRRMDVFPEPSGLTAVLPGESARATEQPRRGALLICPWSVDGIMKSAQPLTSVLTRDL